MRHSERPRSVNALTEVELGRALCGNDLPFRLPYEHDNAAGVRHARARHRAEGHTRYLPVSRETVKRTTCANFRATENHRTAGSQGLLPYSDGAFLSGEDDEGVFVHEEP